LAEGSKHLQASTAAGLNARKSPFECDPEWKTSISMEALEQVVPAQLDHPAMFYGSREEFLEGMVPYVAAGIENGETVFVAARGDYLPALRSALGRGADSVQWAATRDWHPHPSTRLRAFYELVLDEVAAGASWIRLAGEPVWPTGEAELVREWQRYESVLNAVLAPFPVSLVCLYDAATLEGPVLESARCTHPVIRRYGHESESAGYVEPEELLRRWSLQPATPPLWASLVRISSPEELPRARRFLGERARLADVPLDRALDLSVAATEVLTNALRHGGGEVRLLAWGESERFVCQVEDRGGGIDDPLAGYRPPLPEPLSEANGRGLWLARQLVDLLQIASGPEGTTVRLQLARAWDRATWRRRDPAIRS
jgi:anti-sigma regulatory factor (Ser/Thr protein kinase)